MPALRSATDRGPDLTNWGRLPTTERTFMQLREPAAGPRAGTHLKRRLWQPLLAELA